jgi:hypothetical protein
MSTNAGTLFYYFFYDWEIIPTEKTQIKAHSIQKVKKPIPSFELTQLADKLIQLENTSKFADSICWKIAKKDSLNDTLWITQSWSSNKKSVLVQTELNPIRVQLIAYNKCYVDSTFKSIQLKTSDIKSYNQNKILIYPNPANDYVTIESFRELGDIIRNIMLKSTAHLIAMTGSYFRGDSVPVLHPDDEAKFTKVTYNYYQQLNGYDYLKSLGIGYHFYQGKYTDSIMEVLDLNKKTILHIPNVNSGESTKDKHNEVDYILDQIGTIEKQDHETGVIYVKKHSDVFIVILNELYFQNFHFLNLK